MGTISIMSINPKGLNIPEKRRILLQDLKRSRIDIAFVQETHFKENSLPFLRNRSFPIGYHATNPFAKTRGVSILISNKIPWSCTETLLDAGGQYLLLKGKIGGDKSNLGCFLCP